VQEDFSPDNVGRSVQASGFPFEATSKWALRRTRFSVSSTAAAGIDNLRFYQRTGFRIRSVERDAFTPAQGYPPGTRLHGIELRDRVWLDRSLRGQ